MSSTYLQTLSLKEDVEEIDRSLNDFFSERQAAIDRQNIAWNSYDAEMLEIGDVKSQDEEDDTSVDHNLLRHIGARTRSASAERRVPSPDLNVSAHHSQFTDSSAGSSITLQKKSNLTQRQRAKLRSAMLCFLEGSRSEEESAEAEFEKAVTESQEFPLDAFTKLNDLHHKNYDVLMTYLNDYQPQAFGKSFSHDPDYKDLQRSFFNVDETHGSAARGAAAPPIVPLKTKKKKRKH